MVLFVILLKPSHFTCCYKLLAIETFLKTGGPVPQGLRTVGRWHVPGSASGWHWVEGTDSGALTQHMAEWANFCRLEVSPVIEDGEAASGLSRFFGK